MPTYPNASATVCETVAAPLSTRFSCDLLPLLSIPPSTVRHSGVGGEGIRACLPHRAEDRSRIAIGCGYSVSDRRRYVSMFVDDQAAIHSAVPADMNDIEFDSAAV